MANGNAVYWSPAWVYAIRAFTLSVSTVLSISSLAIMYQSFRRSFLLCFTALLLPLAAQSQSLPNETERLFHVGHVWGYIKYFHPGANGCDNNMDSALIRAISISDTSTSYASFEKALIQMFDQAGPIPLATEPEVNVDTLNKMNLDLRWHQDAALPLSVRSKLDSIRENFRPFENCYFERGSNETAYLISEKTYSNTLSASRPYALLLLFRAWNIHNYFSPYRRLIQPAWESVLVDLIPVFEQVSSVLDLHLAFMKYQSRQMDAHSATGSAALTGHFGPRYLPCLFTVVEGKTVVTKVFAGVDDVRVGDVVLSIDGTPVQAIRDSLRPYVHGGTKEIVDRNTSTYLLRGKDLKCTLEVENTDGVRAIELDRSSNAAAVADSGYHPLGDGHIWKILPGNIGYVNVGRLTTDLVPEMYDELRLTKGIIFDSRNYPGEFVIYAVADLLLDSRRAFCNFYFPDPMHPGTFDGYNLYCGPSFKNPLAYEGEVRILQNQMTQSQAEFTIMAWQTHPNAKIIGSQTAGADGNVSTFSYPTSLSMSYSACGVLYPDREETQIVGIEEDITVTPTVEGIRAGRDEVLEVALASILSGGVSEQVDHSFTAVISDEGRLSLTLPASGEYGVVTLYDLLGRAVFTSTYTDTSIDVSSLPNGVYLLEFVSENSAVRRSRVLVP